MSADQNAGHPGGAPGGGHPGGAPGGGHPGGVGSRAVFERQYAGGTPPWDIGRPQPAIVALEDAGALGPIVIDVGCGTGENALFLASRGHNVTGIDAAPAAIDSARAKARERGLTAEFIAADVLEALPAIGMSSDAVTDVGFFHALTDEQRPVFVDALAEVLVSSGVYAMLCFSDRVPGAFGPRRVSEAEIRSAFSGRCWNVREIRPAELHSAVPAMPIVDANLAIVERRNRLVAPA